MIRCLVTPLHRQGVDEALEAARELTVLTEDQRRDATDLAVNGAPSPLLCSLSSSSPSGCELTETSVIMDNTSHKAAREAVDLEVVDADLADLVIECAHGLGRPRAS